MCGAWILAGWLAASAAGNGADVGERVRRALDFPPGDAGLEAALSLQDDGRQVVVAFRELAPHLESGAFERRARAAEFLMFLYLSVDDVPDTAFDCLEPLVRGGDPWARALALQVLGFAWEERATEILGLAVEDDDAWIRLVAVGELATNDLADLAPSARAAARREAARLLARGREALERPSSACTDPDPEACRVESLEREMRASLVAVAYLAAGGEHGAWRWIEEAMFEGPPSLARVVVAEIPALPEGEARTRLIRRASGHPDEEVRTYAAAMSSLASDDERPQPDAATGPDQVVVAPDVSANVSLGNLRGSSSSQ